MRNILLNWHDRQDIPNYEIDLIVIYYNRGEYQYRIATYWKSDNLFHEDESDGVFPISLKTENIVVWAYLPILLEKTTK